MLRVKVIQLNKTAVQISDGTNTRVVPRNVFDEKLKSGEVEVINLKIRCVRKVRNKSNIITAYVITDDTGKLMEVKPRELKDAIRDYKVTCTNLSLTIDNKLIDTEPEEIAEPKKVEVAKPIAKPVSTNTQTQSTVKQEVPVQRPVEKPIETTKVEQKPVEDTKVEQKPVENTNVEQSNAQKDEADNIPDELKEAYAIISNLKSHADYKTSLAGKIGSTVESSRRVSDRQLYFLRKQHDDWFGTDFVERAKKEKKEEDKKAKAIDYYAESVKIANILKNRPGYDWNNSFPKKIYASISKYKKASEKQYYVFDKEAKRLGINPEDYDDSGNLKQVGQANQSAPVQSAHVQSAPTPLTHIEPIEKTEKAKKDLASLVNIEKMASKLIGSSGYRPISNMGVTSADEIVYEKLNNGQLFAVGLQKNVSKTELVIPDTVLIDGVVTPVSGIKNEAFSGTNIRSVVVGANVHDIGQRAFANCVNLIKADLSNGKHTFIAANLFINCINLKEVYVGDKLLRIHECAFHNCMRLNKIDIPNDIEIAKHAFSNCYMLSEVCGSPKTIMESAFAHCIRLKIFDFSHTQAIGTHSFRNCGFEKLKLDGNIFSIGNKAFADCIVLGEVVIEEGVEKLGEYCFAKSTNSFEVGNVWSQVAPASDLEEYLVKAVIDTPKSIDKVGSDTFRHAELVKVFAGSACESACIAFGTSHIIKDSVDASNSTRTRIKAAVIGANPCETLYKTLIKEEENKGNSAPFDMQTKKLVSVDLNKNTLDTLHIEEVEANNTAEPNIMFKAAVSYLQDVADIFTLPLSDKILRLQQTFYKESKEIYSDGYNRIVVVAYTIMDTLEEGKFILALNGNKLILCVDFNMLTNIEVGIGENNINIPIKNYIHTGDRLGNSSSIAGSNAHIKLADNTEINVGNEVLKHIVLNGIRVNRTKTDYAIYVPSQDIVCKFHDGRVYSTVDGEKVLSKDTEDCINVIGILSYPEFLEEIKSSSKGTKENMAFFTKLSSLTKAEVDERVVNIGIIAEEKQAQLFRVSKAIVEQAENLGITGQSLRTITPNVLTPEIFMELSRSYWLIEKDMDWLDTAGRKSLNKTHEYTIGNYMLCEYKSNQVVKFSNAYMSGTKGAYVFELKKNNRLVSLYTSRFSLGEIVNLAVQLTTVPNKGMIKVEDYIKNAPILMTDPYKIDKIDHNLFVKFYDVIYSKDGWTLRKFTGTSSGFNHNGAMFSISMYKPTGVMYLAITTFVEDKQMSEKEDKKVIVQVRKAALPIFPIGDMDRALVVANTTNSNNKKANVLNELMALAVYILCEENRDKFKKIISYCDGLENCIDVPDRYMKARELIINGVTEVEKYRALLDDRVIYMIGTVHNGVLKREGDEYTIEYIQEPEEVSDEDIYDEDIENMAKAVDDIDIEENDEEEAEFDLEDLGFELDDE